MTTAAPPAPTEPEPSRDLSIDRPSIDVRASELEEMVERGQIVELQAIIEHAEPEDLTHEICRLDDATREKLLTLIDAEDAADVLQLLPESQRIDAMEGISTPDAAEILQELPSDEQADLIAELDADDAAELLAELPAEEAANIRELVGYPEDTAGGLMATEFLAFHAQATIGEIVAGLQEAVDSDRGFDAQYVYLRDDEERLVGVVRLRDLLLSKRGQTAADVMIRDFDYVRVSDELDHLEAFFDEHSFFAAPVLDEAGRLVGIIRASAVEQAVGEARGDEYAKSQGLIDGDELRSMPLRKRAVPRLKWLSLNIVLNGLAAIIIAVNQDTLAAVLALTVFLPMISDMSGCSGNQAVGVSMRELSLNVARPSDWFRVLGKEAMVGLVNGTVLGTLIGLGAWLYEGNIFFGLVVGGALGLNTLVGVCIGGTVPLILKGLKKDPALASGPILTTITDMCGFFLVLTFASLALNQISDDPEAAASQAEAPPAAVVEAEAD